MYIYVINRRGDLNDDLKYDSSEEGGGLNYGGRLDGMSQQERGRLWSKLKTGGTGHCIQKRALLGNLENAKLAEDLSPCTS